MPDRSWINRPLLGLSLYSLLASNRGSLFTVYFALFLVAEKGATTPIALTILSAAYVGGSLVGPIAGRISDRRGRRWPFLVAGEAGSLPLFLLVVVLPGYWASGVSFILAEMVLAIGSPAINAFVVDILGEGERGRGYGLLSAASSAGAALGFPIAGVLILRYGFNALFLVSGSVMVAALVMAVWLIPDLRSPPAPARRPMGEMRELTVFSVAVSVRALGWGAVVTFYGTFAYLLGANAFDISLIAISGFIVGAVISAPMGRLVDRVGQIRSMIWGAAISLFAMVFYFLTTTWVELIPAQVTYRVGFALMNPAMLSWVGTLAPSGRRAEYMGFFSLVNSTLWSLGPLAGAIALQAWGPQGLFGFAVGVTLISLVSIPVLYRSRLKGPAVPPARVPIG